MHDVAWRIAVTLKICNVLRSAIEGNGNVYDGRLIPNLTSVTDALTVPIQYLEQSVAQHPELEPTPEEVSRLCSLVGK